MIKLHVPVFVPVHAYVFLCVLGKKKKGPVQNPEVLMWLPKCPSHQLPSKERGAIDSRGSSKNVSHKGEAMSAGRIR